MNIVYLCNYMLEDVLEDRKNQSTFAQAANNKIEQIVTSLALSGHDVTIVSSGLTNNRSRKWFKSFRSKQKDNLYYASIWDLPLFNTLTSILSAIRIVSKLRRKKKVDYILFWNYKPEVALAALYCRLIFGIKIIVDYEDGYFALGHLGRKAKLFSYVENLVSKHIDGAILISKHLENRIRNKPYYVLPGLTNQKVMALKHDKHTTEHEPVTLMYAGGLDYERGLDLLLEALKYTDEEFRLLVSGKGPQVNLLQQSNDPRVNYLGFLEYEETIKRMHQADILINPQRETIEFAKASFPSKIFDYIATNNLIVSSNVGDMKSFGGEAFYIYENDDPKYLANCINEAIADIRHNRCNDKVVQIKKIREDYLPASIGLKITNTLLS